MYAHSSKYLVPLADNKSVSIDLGCIQHVGTEEVHVRALCGDGC